MPSTAPRAISLTDDQLSAVFRATEPLEPIRRSAFLVALATMLRSEPTPLGHGSLGRARAAAAAIPRCAVGRSADVRAASVRRWRES
jgi:hypothetical protein